MKSVTKELMVAALKELLLSKPLGKITVNDIVRQCDAAKQTFYNHFQDKYALFAYAVTTTIQRNLDLSQKSASSFEETVTGYYRCVLADSQFYSSFIRDDIAVNEILGCISSNCAAYFHGRIGQGGGKAALPDEQELPIVFFSVGCAHLLVDWIRGGFKQSPEAMAKINCACLPDSLKQYQ